MDRPKTYVAFEIGNTQMSGWINNFLTRRGEFMFNFPKPGPPPSPPVTPNNKTIVLMSTNYPNGYALVQYIINLGLVTTNVETYLQKNGEDVITLVNNYYNKGYRFFIGTQNSQELSSLTPFFENHSDCCYFNTCSTIYNLVMPPNMIRSVVNDYTLTSYINSYFMLNVPYLLSLCSDPIMYDPLSKTVKEEPAFKNFVYIYETSDYTTEFLRMLEQTQDPSLNITLTSYLLGENDPLPPELIVLLNENPVSNLSVYQESIKTLFFLNSSNPQNLLNKFTEQSWYDNYFFMCDPFFSDLLTTKYQLTYSFLGAGCFSNIGYKLSRQIDPNQDISPIALAVVNLIIELGQWYLNNAKPNVNMTELLYNLIGIQYLNQGNDNNWYWYEKQIYIYHSTYTDIVENNYHIYKEPLIVSSSFNPEVNGGYSISPNPWKSVTYGNGVYVAVASNGYSMRSLDGIYWEEKEVRGIGVLSSVCFGANRFVAVSLSNTTTNNTQSPDRMMNSFDGKNWSITNADTLAYTSIAFNNTTNLFVAVAQYAPPIANATNPCRVRYGTPPSTGSTVCSTPAYPFQCVTFGNGYFVAISTQGFMISTNGSTWTVYKTVINGGIVPNGNWSSITYGNGLYVAVGSSFITNNSVITSSDAINWIARNSPNYYWKSITFGNGLFVVLSNNGKSMTSSDGITWTERNIPNSDWSSVTFGNNLFVAVAVAVASTSSPRTMYSEDGINWFYNPSGYGSLLGNGTSYATGLTSTNIVKIIISPLPPYTIANPYTIEVFFKLNAIENSDEQLITIGNPTNTDISNVQFKIFGTGAIAEKQKKLGVISVIPDLGISLEIITTSTINTDSWYHVAFVKYADSNNIPNVALFLNGTLETQSIGNPSSSLLLTKNITVAGTFGTSENAFNGNISDIRITQERVYTGNFTVPSVPLETTQTSGTNINAIGTGKCVFLTKCRFIKPLKEEVTGVDLTNSGLRFSHLSP